MSRSHAPPTLDRPAVSVLHREPPLTPSRFLSHPYAFLGVLGSAITLAILAAVDGGSVLLRIDEPVARWISDQRTPTWTTIFDAASHLGDNIVIFPLAIIMASFVWRHCRVLAGAILGAAAVRPGLEFVLKAVIDRQRPTIDPIGEFHGPSHPSGHPMAALSFWGLMPAVVALYHGSRRHWWEVTGTSFAIIVAVAASRVYKGAHWLTDVTASLLWGALYLLAVQGVFDRYHHLSECHETELWAASHPEVDAR